MNQEQRKQVEEVTEALTGLHSALQEHATVIRSLAEDEGEKFDNLSDGLKAAESGQAIEAAAETLTAMADSIDEALESIEEAMNATFD